jgi:hypothetical protein
MREEEEGREGLRGGGGSKCEMKWQKNARKMGS